MGVFAAEGVFAEGAGHGAFAFALHVESVDGEDLAFELPCAGGTEFFFLASAACIALKLAFCGQDHPSALEAHSLLDGFDDGGVLFFGAVFEDFGKKLREEIRVIEFVLTFDASETSGRKKK